MYHNNMRQQEYSYSSFRMTWNTNTQEQLQISATGEQEVLNLFQQVAVSSPNQWKGCQLEVSPTQSSIQTNLWYQHKIVG